MKIFVCGGDGYVGWPLAMHLAVHRPADQIIIIDNGLRRRISAGVGADSITPIAPLAERMEIFRNQSGRNNLSYIEQDLSEASSNNLFAEHKPGIVYHLAQQPSAPWSMEDVDQAVHTLQNNETSNLRILFSMRRYCPEAHLIKLGSFGEYAKCGLDIPQGYFHPEIQGRKASRPVPFPREADDIYHITKINDSNFIGMACRKWGLRVTDVMQATVFGSLTDEILLHKGLMTRFDCDDYFGTVLNRFLAQALTGHPITVYGTGHQRTGLMGLEASVASLVRLSMDCHRPAPGEHRVINHVSERNFSINELAHLIRDLAAGWGFRVPLEHKFDPRQERDPCKAGYRIQADWVESEVKTNPIATIVTQTFEILQEYQDRIEPKWFQPRISWQAS